MKVDGKKRPIALAIVAMGAILSCGRTTEGSSPPGGDIEDTAPTSAPAPTPTTYPTPIPPASTPSTLPADSELRALIEYANTMAPVLAHAGLILQRDGEILKAAEEGKDEVLCDGRLAADNEAMKEILGQARAVAPPADAQAIHDLVLRSGDAWTEALDSVERFCDTGNALHKVRAALKFWEAALALQDAGNRFWLLIVSEGVEDWVRR